MNCSQILPYLFVGSYPACAADIDRLSREHGITAVLTLQGDEDFAARSIDWDSLRAYYARRGIEVRWLPVRDFDSESLRKHLCAGAQAVDELAKAGHKVYVHCTMGMGRSPSVIIAYLHWMLGWDLDRALEHVSRCRSCVPDLAAIRLASADRQRDKER